MSFLLAQAHLQAASDILSYFAGGYLTANSPAAVTILLFSLLVKVEMTLEAKLGSWMVRPFPVMYLGGMAVIMSGDCGAVSQYRQFAWDSREPTMRLDVGGVCGGLS